MPAWTVKLESGLPALLARIESAESGPSAAMVTLTTSAGPKRSASENYRVLAVQRSQFRRDPWFLNASERSYLTGVLRKTLQAMYLETMLEAAHAVGALMVTAYREHIQRGESRGGPMPALTKGAQHRKDIRGKGGEPVLVDTGELRDCITYRVEQVR